MALNSSPQKLLSLTLFCAIDCAGMAAADGKDRENAERHYNNAFGLAEESPYRVDQAQVRYWYARVLLSREDADDKDRALSDKMGMGGLIARIDALRR